VVRVNATLPEKARIRKFLLLYKELDPDDEELTRTKKIRRKFINQKYVKEIAALYGDVEELPIEPGRQDGHIAYKSHYAYHETGRRLPGSAEKEGFLGAAQGRDLGAKRIFFLYAIFSNRSVHGIHLRLGGAGFCLDL